MEEEMLKENALLNESIVFEISGSYLSSDLSSNNKEPSTNLVQCV